MPRRLADLRTQARPCKWASERESFIPSILVPLGLPLAKGTSSSEELIMVSAVGEK